VPRQAGSRLSSQTLGRMSLSPRQLLYALCLSFPIWGLVLAFGLLSLSFTGSQTPGEPIVFSGVLAPVIGAIPIFRMSNQTLVKRAAIFIGYYVACAIAMFVVGWAALGVFGLAK